LECRSPFEKIFQFHQFSTYFEGYGLYEDADFIRVLQFGKMYQYQSSKLNTHVIGRPTNINMENG
jgi:hypothetical protein